MRCHECNGEDIQRSSVELTTPVGEYAVVDRSVPRPVCKQCSSYTVPSDVLQTVELRAAVVAFTDAPRVTGAMLRFAREALDMTQAGLAARIGTTPESLSRWERLRLNSFPLGSHHQVTRAIGAPSANPANSDASQCRRPDLNRRHRAYEARALTS